MPPCQAGLWPRSDLADDTSRDAVYRLLCPLPRERPLGGVCSITGNVGWWVNLPYAALMDGFIRRQ